MYCLTAAVDRRGGARFDIQIVTRRIWRDVHRWSGQNQFDAAAIHIHIIAGAAHEQRARRPGGERVIAAGEGRLGGIGAADLNRIARGSDSGTAIPEIDRIAAAIDRYVGVVLGPHRIAVGRNNHSKAGDDGRVPAGAEVEASVVAGHENRVCAEERYRPAIPKRKAIVVAIHRHHRAGPEGRGVTRAIHRQRIGIAANNRVAVAGQRGLRAVFEGYCAA